MEGGWAAKLFKDEPYNCWSQSGFLTGTGADRHWATACCVLGVCVVMGSGTDTSIGFIAGREQDNVCGLLTSSMQAGVGEGAGDRGGW